MNRDLTTLRNRPSSTQLLARILDTPDLATSVQALPAPALTRLIDAVGLEDAGEIIAFASTEQLAEVFDVDLWRSDRPGDDERFDPDRFLVWLEVMMEAGDSFVAERLASLPEDLVALALHGHVLVLDVDELLVQMRDADQDDAEAVEKALSNCLSEEIDEYQLVARHPEGWDTVLAAVLALDRDHHAQLGRILERLCAMSDREVDEAGGLFDVLTSAEMLEEDVAAARDERRAEAGHIAPSDARAFLELARQKLDAAPLEHDAITRAYFRELRGQSRPAPSAEPKAAPQLARLLADAGVVEPAPRLLLSSGAAPSREPLLVRAMRGLAERDPAAFLARSEEIAYLANVLAAGASIEGRRYRPAEALRKAIEVCSHGLELATGKGDPVEVLGRHPAEGLFRLAWSAGAGG
jgi:hypothetical protein